MNSNGVSPAASATSATSDVTTCSRTRAYSSRSGSPPGSSPANARSIASRALAAHRLAVDAGGPRRGETVLAEAEPEEIAHPRAERDEVALVRVAVLEAQVVQRLRADAGDTERRDVGGERARVGAGIRIRGTELGHVPVAEGVLGRALGVRRGERAVVEEHRPRPDGEPAPVGGGDRLGQHVRRLAHRRLQPRGAQRRPGREEDGAALEEPHLAHGVVREDVPALVVGGRHRDAAEPAAVLDVVQHGLDPLVREVGREAEDRACPWLAGEPAAVDRQRHALHVVRRRPRRGRRRRRRCLRARPSGRRGCGRRSAPSAPDRRARCGRSAPS